MKIATDSTPPEAPKDPETSTIFQIYRAIATPDETRALEERYRSGIGWGDAKKALAARVEQEVGAARARYEALMADKATIDALLAEGAAKARVTARRTLERVRTAIGISRG
jgi:tryptophanyl-tRNA synthetase